MGGSWDANGEKQIYILLLPSSSFFPPIWDNRNKNRGNISPWPEWSFLCAECLCEIPLYHRSGSWIHSGRRNGQFSLWKNIYWHRFVGNGSWLVLWIGCLKKKCGMQGLSLVYTSLHCSGLFKCSGLWIDSKNVFFHFSYHGGDVKCSCFWRLWNIFLFIYFVSTISGQQWLWIWHRNLFVVSQSSQSFVENTTLWQAMHGFHWFL